MLLALTAAGRPLTLHDFRHQLQRMGHHFGISAFLLKHDRDVLPDSELRADLTYLEGAGHVVRRSDGAWELTPSGREIGARMDDEMGRLASTLSRVVNDAVLASGISVAVNAVLAGLKLTVGFLLNSVALIADGFDSTVDVASAIAVYIGIRTRREFASTVFIVVVMVATALFIGFESVSKLLAGEVVRTSWLAFVAAAISGVVCYLMSVYQHLVGKRVGSLSLLSQSVDSRNHVIQAGAVLVGLVFALLGIHFVDAVVGLVVALLIMRSAIELTAEMRRTAGGESLDASHFQREYERIWNARNRRYFESWLLLLLDEPHSREDIMTHYHEVFDATDLPVVRHFSPARTFDLPEHLDSVLEGMLNSGKIELRGRNYHITGAGREAVNAAARRWRFVFQ